MFSSDSLNDSLHGEEIKNDIFGKLIANAPPVHSSATVALLSNVHVMNMILNYAVTSKLQLSHLELVSKQFYKQINSASYNSWIGYALLVEGFEKQIFDTLATSSVSAKALIKQYLSNPKLTHFNLFIVQSPATATTSTSTTSKRAVIDGLPTMLVTKHVLQEADNSVAHIVARCASDVLCDAVIVEHHYPEQQEAVVTIEDLDKQIQEAVKSKMAHNNKASNSSFLYAIVVTNGSKYVGSTLHVYTSQGEALQHLVHEHRMKHHFGDQVNDELLKQQQKAQQKHHNCIVQ